MDAAPTNRSAVVCTGNAHKVDELAGLLTGFTLEPLEPGTTLPPEVGSTFLDNARIKAYAGHEMFPDRWVIADDSGLCVDALDGAPGVRSARFAGEHATDADNTEQLLVRLRDLVDDEARGARFVCVLVAVAPDGTEFVGEGTVHGRIAIERAGDAGFGYDPVFVPEGHTRSFAELGADVKAGMSHRARAAQQLAERIEAAG
ncbi:MAG: non-canonical purine pyrophosphatase, rdgB/HAM1 family [Thermoleophilia bacterium]|jgi:XTP/dITP diphosphohydrolase|nr:non-canonical purine pyrophosphatase, rdgB/HAM1 family [Thermoleophilia bacterium]